MKVKLLKDHNGKETDNRPYPKGKIVEVTDEHGEILIKNRWAETVSDTNSETESAPMPKQPKKRGRK
jgi:hypothetical protein